MKRLGLGILLVVVSLGSACDGSKDAGPKADAAAIKRSLVQEAELPRPDWTSFRVSSNAPKVNLCGKTVDVPEPIRKTAIAWIRDPNDGPIFGERIEVYKAGDAEKRLGASKLPKDSCDWSRDGANWRSTFEKPLDLGDDSRLTLITSRDRPDSFNYEMAVRSGDVLVLTVLNIRAENRELADQLCMLAWNKAVEEGIVYS